MTRPQRRWHLIIWLGLALVLGGGLGLSFAFRPAHPAPFTDPTSTPSTAPRIGAHSNQSMPNLTQAEIHP